MRGRRQHVPHEFVERDGVQLASQDDERGHEQHEPDDGGCRPGDALEHRLDQRGAFCLIQSIASNSVALNSGRLPLKR